MVFIPFLSSRLSVHVNKRDDDYKPGDRVEGYVRLHTISGVDARKLVVRLTCAEWVNPKKDSGKEGEAREVKLWKKEKVLGGPHKYRAGEWEFEFILPKDAMPTLNPEPFSRHPNEGAGLKWYLHAKMDVPNSIDLHGYKQLFIY